MKKNIIAGILVFMFSFIALFLALDNRQETYALTDPGTGSTMSPDSRIPDNNFYNCLVNDHNVRVDSNGLIKSSSFNKISAIRCENKNIKSVRGIEYFTKLKSLRLNYNDITEIELSTKNSKIEGLELKNNKLKTIDLSNLPNIKYVYLSHNQLEKVTGLSSKISDVELCDNKLASMPNGCNYDNCYIGPIVKFDYGFYGWTDTVNICDYVKEPDKPEANGYKFLGWYVEYGGPFDFSQPIEWSTVLVARWERISSSSSSSSSSGNTPKPSSNSAAGSTIKLKYKCGSISCSGLPATVTRPKPSSGTTKVNISKVEPSAKNSNYIFWYWTNKSETKKYKSNCSGLSNCKTTISISKNNTLHAVWRRNDLAQEEEIETSSNNILVKTMIVAIVLFAVACLGYLIYNLSHSKN